MFDCHAKFKQESLIVYLSNANEEKNAPISAAWKTRRLLQIMQHAAAASSFLSCEQVIILYEQLVVFTVRLVSPWRRTKPIKYLVSESSILTVSLICARYDKDVSHSCESTLMPVSGVRSTNVGMTQWAQFNFCVISMLHQRSGAQTGSEGAARWGKRSCTS